MQTCSLQVLKTVNENINSLPKKKTFNVGYHEVYICKLWLINRMCPYASCVNRQVWLLLNFWCSLLHSIKQYISTPKKKNSIFRHFPFTYSTAYVLTEYCNNILCVHFFFLDFIKKKLLDALYLCFYLFGPMVPS